VGDNSNYSRFIFQSCTLGVHLPKALCMWIDDVSLVLWVDLGGDCTCSAKIVRSI
jgi:hypothetical protein